MYTTNTLQNVGTIEVHTASFTRPAMALNGRVTLDGRVIFEKRWTR